MSADRTKWSSVGWSVALCGKCKGITKDLVGVREGGAGDLTLADTNEEAANLLALQTRQSLAQSSLSLANQAEQSVLNLIR